MAITLHSEGIPYFIVGTILLYNSVRLIRRAKAQGQPLQWGKAFLAVATVILVLFLLSRFSNP